MVSDTELVTRLKEILAESDLDTTTPGAVRRQLEAHFGVSLSDRKKFITQQIDEYLSNSVAAANNGDGNEENGGGDDDVDVRESNGAAEDSDVEQQEEEIEQEEEGDEEESGVDDEGDNNKKKKKNKGSSDGETDTKKKRGGGFTKPCSISPQLQELVGASEMARTEIVKQIWVYIKANDLQDPKNRRKIKCDKKLHSIFRVDTIDMFQMNKALSKHIWPLEIDEEPSTVSKPPEKKRKPQKEEDVKKSKGKAKQQKGGQTGFLKPLQLSEAFVKFLGTGETTIARSDAVKRIWDYIKQNDLQDPSDRRRILCDEKLKELFEVDSFNGFSVSKYLSAHLTKIEQ